MTNDRVPEGWWPGPDEPGGTIWKTQRAVERAADAMLAPVVPTSVVRVLRLLERQPGQSAADLARHLGFAPQTVAATVQAAEAAGYLERRPHPVHGRVRQLYLTEEGREVFGQAKKIFRTLERALGADLDPEARRRLSEQLQTIAARADGITRDVERKRHRTQVQAEAPY